MKKYFANISIFIKKQKILTALLGVSILMLISIFFIPGKKSQKSEDTYKVNNLTNINPKVPDINKNKTSVVVSGSKEKESNKPLIFTWILSLFGKDSSSNTTASSYIIRKSSPIASESITPTSAVQKQETSITNNLSNPSEKIEGLEKYSESSNQPVSNTNNQTTDIQIIFKDENGELMIYNPPSGSTISQGWLLYINKQDGFEIEIPDNWQINKTQYNGHEGVILYPPGEDISKVDVQSISFVPWQSDYLTTSATYTSPILINGISGNIYTKGIMGSSPVAAVLQPYKKYFALGSSSSDASFLNIFDHMLRSVKFTNQ